MKITPSHRTAGLFILLAMAAQAQAAFTGDFAPSAWQLAPDKGTVQFQGKTSSELLISNFTFVPEAATLWAAVLLAGGFALSVLRQLGRQQAAGARFFGRLFSLLAGLGVLGLAGGSTARASDYSVGNRVWLDYGQGGGIAQNAIQDGTEPGIANVEVQLLRFVDNAWQTIQTTRTDSEGYYRFDSVQPGTNYSVFISYAHNFLPGGPLFNMSIDNTCFKVNTGDDRDNNGKPILNAGFGEIGVYSELFDLRVAPEPLNELDVTASGAGAHGPSGDEYDNLTIDFGFFPIETIGDLVWEDLNGNGIQDGTDEHHGIPGVTLMLSGTDDKGNDVTATTTTGSNGHYYFSPPLGTYSVTVVPPAGYTASPTLQGPDRRLDSNPSPSFTTPVDMTVDFGFYRKVVIGNLVWNDANQNGIQDNGEPGISGVTVNLTGIDGTGQSVSASTTTDGLGRYSFYEPPGTYTVSLIPLVGYTASPPLRGTNNSTTLISGAGNMHINFGFYKTPGSFPVITLGTASKYALVGRHYVLDNCDLYGDAAIGADPNVSPNLDLRWAAPGRLHGPVYQETAATILGNPIITYPDGGGIILTNGAAVSRAFSDASAAYDAALTLVADETIPGGRTLYEINATHGGQYVVHITGDIITTLYLNPCPGSITKFILIVDGTIKLPYPAVLGTPADPKDVLIVVKGDGADVSTGFYFCGTILAPYRGATSYQWIGAMINGYKTPRAGGDLKVTLMGYPNCGSYYARYEPLLLSVGNRVWLDNGQGGGIAQNGLQDGTEPGIANVEVQLLRFVDNAYQTIQTTRTDYAGYYRFDSIQPGTNYSVFISYVHNFLPGGPLFNMSIDNTYFKVNTGDDRDNNGKPIVNADLGVIGVISEFFDLGMVPEPLRELDVAVSDARAHGPLGDEYDNLTIDFGFFQAPVKIGNLVWNDLNRNGMQDQGEPGISGVTVNLTGTDSAGHRVTGSTTTDGRGLYSFVEPPGTYTVSVIPPAGYTASPPLQGTDRTLDSNPSDRDNGTTPTALPSGAQDVSIDFGFYQPSPPATVTIGNLVWEDVNGNGVQDQGEPGISGVTVTLLGPGGAVVATTTTDDQGRYSFQPAPGAYTVSVVTPGGFAPTATGIDSDPSSSPTTPETLLAGAQDLTLDFGFYRTPTLALLKSIRAYAQGYSVMVEWQTASEVGTLAFDLYRLEGAEWVLVNEDPVLAENSLTGASYKVADNTGDGLAAPTKAPFRRNAGQRAVLADGNTYRLVEWCEDGSERLVGTYNVRVDQERLAPAKPWPPVRPWFRAAPR